MALNVGDRFTSFKDFEEAFETFKAETNTEFCISDSRTLESAKKKFAQRCENAPESLKYYHVRYKCIHGGKFKRNANSRGLRNTGTLKMGCEALISVILSEDSKALVIAKMRLEHNHDTSEAIYIEVPTYRKRNLERLRVSLPESKEKRKRKVAHGTTSQCSENVNRLQDLTNFNATNPQMPGSDEADMSGPNETEMSGPDETETLHNSTDKVSHSLPEEELESSEHKLCRCGIGTFDLTKQDLMKMEVEEHYHRLEVLQLQKVYETERIEKMRYLYDLKIQLAEQELQNSNF